MNNKIPTINPKDNILIEIFYGETIDDIRSQLSLFLIKEKIKVCNFVNFKLCKLDNNFQSILIYSKKMVKEE